MSLYDSIAELYDPWSVSVTEDVGFYVEEAKRAGSPVVELAVGTGRIAVPTAAAGVRVIGIDSSPGMLEVCRRRAELAGVSELLDAIVLTAQPTRLRACSGDGREPLDFGGPRR